MPSAEEIEALRQTTKPPTAEQLGRQPIPTPPKIEIQKPVQPLNIEALARAFYDGKSGFQKPVASREPALLVFVTLSMPEASLARIVAQAARSDAVMVIRGLEGNSMRQTLARIQKLIGEHKVAWQIDPEAFRRFGVSQAPAVVLTAGGAGVISEGAGCENGCISQASFALVAGDVSLDYALEHIARHRPAFDATARGYLRKLRS